MVGLTRLSMPSVETSIKMEDRKRSALDSIEHSAPPTKRQATVNGSKEHPDTDMPWRADIEEFTKDAALRQMREYKKLASDLESQLNTLKSNATYHDDHIRVIDAWFKQLIDEVALFASPSNPPVTQPFNSALLSADREAFDRHLTHLADHIRETIQRLFSSLPSSSPEVNALQERLATVLKAEKASTAELQRVISERDQVSDRLENAVGRYMLAEKKLDRAKSAQVAKLEAQAIAKTDPASSATTKRDASGEPNGVPNASLEALEAARKEADAAAAKRLEQIQQLTSDNKSLIQKLSVSDAKASNLTDEDYAHCELFKTLKSSHDDIVKRINDLEATNIQLREEAKQLHSERTAYREEIDNDLRNLTLEHEEVLSSKDGDLTRIRKNRDGLEAELKVLQQAQVDRTASTEQMQHLLEAREARIEALESEVSRLQDHAAQNGDLDAESDIEALKTKIRDLERDKVQLANEMRSMETAFKKAQAASSKVITNTLDAENRIARMAQEKAKAEQKYFGQMKLNQNQSGELRNLRAANSTSAEIITRHKEEAANYKSAIISQDKAIAELKENLTAIQYQLRESQSNVSNNKTIADRLSSQISDVKKALDAKDSTLSSAAEARRNAEVEAEKLKVRLADTEKQLESWKKRAAGEKTDEYDMLRSMALCTVCRKNFKDTALKSCGHVFCEECVDTRLEARMRKCPNCNKAFGAGEKMRVTL